MASQALLLSNNVTLGQEKQLEHYLVRPEANRFTVSRVPSDGSSKRHDGEVVELEAVWSAPAAGEVEVSLCHELVRVVIRAPVGADLRRFKGENEASLADFVISLARHSVSARDLLWATPTGSDEVWLLSLTSTLPHEWMGSLSCVRRERTETTYLLETDLGRSRKIRDHFESFRQCVPSSPLVRSNELLRADRVLTVRVAPSEHWLLRVPFTQFARLSLGGFGAYFAIECVVTDAGFIKLAHERSKFLGDLTNIEAVLESVVVVVNRYKQHSQDARLTHGLSILHRVLSAFRELSFFSELGSQVVSLRWYFDPAPDQVVALLSDPSVRYVLADFVVDEDKWRAGEGQPTNWLAHDDVLPDGWNGTTPQYIETNSLDLTHVQLMRVFHCNSIYDAYNGESREPADAQSIVARLLTAGAHCVEGAMTREGALDFVCTTLRFLCAPRHARLALAFQEPARALRVVELLKEVDDLLAATGYPTLDTPAATIPGAA